MQGRNVIPGLHPFCVPTGGTDAHGGAGGSAGGAGAGGLARRVRHPSSNFLRPSRTSAARSPDGGRRSCDWPQKLGPMATPGRRTAARRSAAQRSAATSVRLSIRFQASPCQRGIAAIPRRFGGDPHYGGSNPRAGPSRVQISSEARPALEPRKCDQPPKRAPPPKRPQLPKHASAPPSEASQHLPNRGGCRAQPRSGCCASHFCGHLELSAALSPDCGCRKLRLAAKLGATRIRRPANPAASRSRGRR